MRSGLIGRFAENPNDPWRGLSNHSLNVLLNAGIRTPEAVRALYREGKLAGLRYRRGRWDTYAWSWIRGLGPVTLKEVAAWAWIELPEPVPKKRCRLCGKVL